MTDAPSIASPIVSAAGHLRRRDRGRRRQGRAAPQAQGHLLAPRHPRRLPRRLGARRAHSAWIDPFFFAMPSDDRRPALRLDRPRAPREGPLWYHLWVTMEEALIGFVTGSVAGIVVGVALGRNRFAADVFSIYIKVDQLHPARRAGADLHHDLRPRAGLEGGAGLRHGLLRRLRQRLPGRARGRPGDDRQRPDPRRLQLAADPLGRSSPRR